MTFPAVFRPISALPALPLALALLAVVGLGGGCGDGEGSTPDAGADAADAADAVPDDALPVDTATPDQLDSGDAGDAGEPPVCDPEKPQVVPPVPGPDDCDLADRTPAACTTGEGQPGLQRCTPYEIAEDMTVGRVGPCQETCSAADQGSSRPCSEGGVAGVQLCDLVSGTTTDERVWTACLLEACLACQPGQTRPCGPGTNYPDSDQQCLLSEGIPYWFEGDCST